MGTNEAAAGGRASRDLQVPGEVDVRGVGRHCDDRREVSVELSAWSTYCLSL